VDIKTSSLVDGLIIAHASPGVWSGHLNHLNYGGPHHISETAEARVAKFCKQVGYVKSQHADDKSSLKGYGQSHVTHFKFWGRQ